MGTRVRFLVEASRTAAFHMARDFYFLKLAEENESALPVFSVYSFFKPSVTVGRHQKNLDFLKKAEELSIEVAKRPTGGRAVLHLQADITYSFVFRDMNGEAKSIRQAYDFAKPILASFLKCLGLKADSSSEVVDPYREKTLCFLSRQHSDITVHGQKACGNALLKLKRAFLLQGTFHYDLDRDLAAALFGKSAAEMLIKRTLLLKNFAPELNISAAAAIFERVLAGFGYEVEHSRLFSAEIEEIEKTSKNFEILKSCC